MSFADPRHTRADAETTRGTEQASIAPGRRHFGPGRASVHARGERDEASRAGDRPRGSPYRRSIDWERVRLVGAGLIVGAILGAGAALLLAPQSGLETRTEIQRRARAARRRAADGWDDLAEELRDAALRTRRRARRAVRRAQRRAAEALR